MKAKKNLALSGIVLASLAPAALAQSVAAEKQVTLGVAEEIGMATIDQCRKDGFKVSVTVVNRAGQPILLLRDDGSGPHTGDASRRKAYTALTFKAKTADVQKRILDNPGLAPLNQFNDVLILAGGVPLRAGNEVIGAVGVGGAPSGDKDEACANAGIDKVADRLK